MTQLRVHVDIAGGSVLAGVAYFHVRRGRVSTTFVYDPDYLADPNGYDLEPGLPRHAGQQSCDGLPGSFADCAPDRWGRNLIDKRRRALQRETEQRLPAATEVDYLTGVTDVTRQGNLRFTGGDGPFLSPDDGVPKLVSLPLLLAAADKITDRAGLDDLAAVKALLDAGSGSLGGARPKASIRGDNGGLLIAKFPHRDDEWDVLAWEKTMLDLAGSAKLRVPRARLTQVGSRNVLLLERFDRNAAATRRGYLSAMTMLGVHDGDERDYDDIAQALTEWGAAVKDDLAELFGRAAFNVAVRNTDDHLRNHGFLRERGGWILSPVFDVNPDPDMSRPRVTSMLGAVDADTEVEALLDLARAWRLTDAQARASIGRVVAAVSRWRPVAAANGIANRELTVFDVVITTQLTALRRLIDD